MDGLLIPGVVLVSVGLLFKVGAVPFHSWTPDVYQGAPTPVTGFMAACTKVAAFGAILRVVYVGVAGSALGLAAGAVGRRHPDHGGRLGAGHHPDRHQAHAGLLLDRARRASSSSVCWPSTGPASPRSLFYLAAYGFTTIGAFAVVTLVRDSAGPRRRTCRSGPAWAGATRCVAGVFALFLLLAFAGIPLTSGFTAKFAVFAAAVAHGGAWLVVVGVLASAIAAFFYVRVIVLMYFSEPAGEATHVVAPSVRHHGGADHRHGRHAGPRGPPLAPARPGDRIVAVPAVTSAPATLSLPTASPELAARLQEGLAAVDALMRSEIDHDDPFVAQASAHLPTPEASASARC